MVAEMSLVVTFYLLCKENYKWWWPLFLFGAMPSFILTLHSEFSNQMAETAVFVWGGNMCLLGALAGGAVSVVASYALLCHISRNHKLS
jgi:cobalamin biosynthesis protein CobD/CbiB